MTDIGPNGRSLITDAFSFPRQGNAQMVLRDERALADPLVARIAHSLVNAMEAKSRFLRGHSDRVAASAAAIAEELGLEHETVELIRLAGWLHDVGKIGVRDEVLDKPAELSPDEMAHVHEHVAIGLRILAPLEGLGPVLKYVAHHHERRDGSGYPHGLKGSAISIGGRILGAADVLDALTSPRAYRDAMPVDEALAYMSKGGPRVVCPDVLPALTRLVTAGRVLVFLNDHEH
jgi:putative nucleotidyltransferase with HDIG domain